MKKNLKPENGFGLRNDWFHLSQTKQDHEKQCFLSFLQLDQ